MMLSKSWRMFWKDVGNDYKSGVSLHTYSSKIVYDLLHFLSLSSLCEVAAFAFISLISEFVSLIDGIG